MKSNLTGLVKALKEASILIHTLYLLLKDRGSDEPITQEEIQIVSGKVSIDSQKTAELVDQLQKREESIEKAFQKQREAAQLTSSKDLWNQAYFEELLSKWLIILDKSFDKVETPEFIDLLTYVHHTVPPLSIPSRFTIKRRVMDMGNNVIEEIKKMFS
ncbi:hypothetical protein C0991_011198, partial [Blastosporella zonata]